MRVLAACAGPELAVQPERIEVIVVPVERDPERVVNVDEGLIAADRDRPPDAGEATRLAAKT